MICGREKKEKKSLLADLKVNPVERVRECVDRGGKKKRTYAPRRHIESFRGVKKVTKQFEILLSFQIKSNKNKREPKMEREGVPCKEGVKFYHGSTRRGRLKEDSRIRKD